MIQTGYPYGGKYVVNFLWCKLHQTPLKSVVVNMMIHDIYFESDQTSRRLFVACLL